MSRQSSRALALAALLVPALLAADSVSVTFDEALTNGTGWVYRETDANKDGNVFLRLPSSVESPRFPFYVTSVEIVLGCTSTTPTRYLKIAPPSAEGQLAAVVGKERVKEVQTFRFAEADAVRSFTLSLDGSGSTGNWYVYSAVITGVPLVAAPTGLSVGDVRSTRCRLSWANPVNAVSNRIDVSLVTYREGAAKPSPEYDFAAFANDGGNSVAVTDAFTNALPAFAGSSLVYLPAGSSGVIQVSTEDEKGCLVHAGFDDCSRLSLLVSLRIPNRSQGTVFGIGYEAAPGVTNEIARLPMTLGFQTNLVSLASLPAGVPLLFNTRGARTRRRVQIDYLAFVSGDRALYEQTTPVASVPVRGGSATGVGALAPATDYRLTVTAFDAAGHASAPSAPVEVRTAPAGSDAFTLSLR